MDKLIITAALTGSQGTKRQTPYIPVTPEEIAASALEAWREGASMAHIHIRDDNQKSVSDLTRFERVRQLVREAGCDMILNYSTGAGGGNISPEDRLNPIRLSPEVASFDAGSTNMGPRVFMNPPDFLDKMARLMKEHGVKPELECFDTSMIDNAVRIAGEGLIDPPFWFQFVLGVRGGARATPKQVMHMVELLPPNSRWAVCAIGPNQLPMNVLGILLGGHVRTGLEDNLYYRKGELAQGNGQLVARLVRIARELGREIASPGEARAMLGLKPFTP